MSVRGCPMGSVITKVAGGVVAALLAQAALAAAPSVANAEPIGTVPCDTARLIEEITNANNAGTRTLHLAAFCNYALTTAAETGTGPDGLPIIRGDVTLI